jgi:L-type amino acid transporter 9
LIETTILTFASARVTIVTGTPSSIVSSVGSVGASLFLWVFGYLLALAGTYVWVEFACMFPRSGGEKGDDLELHSLIMKQL